MDRQLVLNLGAETRCVITGISPAHLDAILQKQRSIEEAVKSLEDDVPKLRLEVKERVVSTATDKLSDAGELFERVVKAVTDALEQRRKAGDEARAFEDLKMRAGQSRDAIAERFAAATGGTPPGAPSVAGKGLGSELPDDAWEQWAAGSLDYTGQAGTNPNGVRWLMGALGLAEQPTGEDARRLRVAIEVYRYADGVAAGSIAADILKGLEAVRDRCYAVAEEFISLRKDLVEHGEWARTRRREDSDIRRAAFEGRVALAAAVLVPPGVVAGVYGANVWKDGDVTKAGMFGVMIAVAIFGGAAGRLLAPAPPPGSVEDESTVLTIVLSLTALGIAVLLLATSGWDVARSFNLGPMNGGEMAVVFGSDVAAALLILLRACRNHKPRTD